MIIVFRAPVGYPRVIILTRALPAGKILYPYPRVKFYTHTRTHRIGYPRVLAPAGKIAISTLDRLKGRYYQLHPEPNATSQGRIQERGTDGLMTFVS